MSPDMPVPSVGDGLPKQMDFHLAFYKLCRITHRMMKRLYLNVESKFDTWETIRSITEQLQEFRVSLPKHLRIEHVREDQDDIICRQAIFLDFFISHILNISCRPLFIYFVPRVCHFCVPSEFAPLAQFASDSEPDFQRASVPRTVSELQRHLALSSILSIGITPLLCRL